AFQGLHDGGRTTRRYPRTALRADGSLSLLFVVHGFPPDTWAGTEIYTQNLALELGRRGHQVTILARAPAEGDEPDFSLREDEFQGLRVLRMTHRLAHTRLADSFRQPRAEEVFRRVLADLAPDLVHFQHLIHTSVGLVEVAKEHGLPTVITCHDYWGLCPRVQLIRPDGVRCPTNMGSGCYLCVKEERLDWIPAAKKLGELGAGPLDGLAAEAARGGLFGAGARRRAEEYTDLKQREHAVPAAYAACDLRISPSRYLRQVYLDSGHFDPHTFLFSDNGMRTDHVQALEKTDGGGVMRFGFVGSLVWYKGGQVLLEAMRALDGLPAELHVHGDFKPDSDPHHGALAAIAGDNVHFRGRFDNARLSEVYAEIDVLIVPSVWVENSPITIHEAWMTRTPVIASDIGGMAEFVRDGVDGLHFRTGDAADLARVLRRCVEEPGLLGELSQDFQAVKTIADNAAELEFRYRALCCVDRSRQPARVTLRGHETARREGGAEVQGADLLLLRPGGSAAEYDLHTLPPGPTQLRIDVLALGAEPTLQQAGRLLINGVEVGRIEPFQAGGEDELRPFAFAIDLPADARLRVEPRLGADGPEATLRIACVHGEEVTP
ncbi:MAG: glycosyltransferase family 4 protein, partial [Planctomycetota bacterium]|nr:glycosyltransferase family 4 protein [Planctomycetota bacterium]